MLCERCSTQCELCPSDWPYSEVHWICPKCDSTYCIEDYSIPKSQST